MAPRESDVSALDAIAICLLETSDVNMLNDQALLEQKNFEESPRKDSLGYELFLDDVTLQLWEGERSDPDLPTMGMSSGIFDVEADESWPCLNRIPTPGIPELDAVFEDLSWETVIQDGHARVSCGILPSCPSSSPSAGGSPCGSPYGSPRLAVRL